MKKLATEDRSMATELSAKGRIRTGHRRAAGRLIEEAQGILSSDEPDHKKLLQQMRSLEEKLVTLKQLDGEILSLVEESQIEGESDHLTEKIHACIVEINCHCSKSSTPCARPTTGAADTGAEVSSMSTTRVKLPKLSIRHFDGNITK